VLVTRRLRVVAWTIILVLAAFQTWANRYAVSPDGVSYLDLSDAVVLGKWGELANLYWSPLYPFLIGVARVIGGAAPAREVPILHAVNFAAFAAMCAAFEYFLISAFALARTVRRPILAGAWGTGCVYALFGATALTMTPLELSTPDWLSNAAIFAALGALLRLQQRPNDRRSAVVLGITLGAGALAKSFLVPWAIVCFVVLAVRLRRNSTGALARAIAVWLVFVAPWTAVLSQKAHRLTFGDAGRLTWVWYVNWQDTPSLAIVPPVARTPQTDAILRGVAAPGAAPGTNPMWYDPARWNATLHPKLNAGQELTTLRVMTMTIFGSLSVLLLISVPVAVAGNDERRALMRAAGIVIVPCLAGLLGYAMVLVTARYVMAFTLGAILVSLATLPIPRRVHPAWLLVGVIVPVLLLALSPISAYGLSMVTAILGAMLVGSRVPTRRHILWMVLVPLALVFSLMLFSPATPTLMRVGATLFALGLWASAAGAIKRGTPVAFARGAMTALVVGVGLVLVGRAALRVDRDAQAARRSASDNAGNVQWKIAQDLASKGIVPGTRVAIIGPPAESYWARTARVQIAAAVPDPLVPVWWMLQPSARDSLLARFAQRGAEVAIVTRPPADSVMDSRWVPLRYHAWYRRLK
jgi:hypothetical protein